MKKHFTKLFSVITCISLTACGAHVGGNAPAELMRLTPDIAAPSSDVSVSTDAYIPLVRFCSDFTLATAQRSDGKSNTLTSPLSAYLALAMVKEGADGKTLEEMSAAMGDISGEDIYSLISHLTTLENTTLNIADSVWVDDSFTPKQAFLDTLAKHYLAEGFKIDLTSAEHDVNSWIEERTNTLIKNMLNDTALDNAVMALINTLYMEAKWANEFASEATHEREFTNADGTKKNVDFMYKSASLGVIESDAYIGVMLPYSDGSLTFVALMPKRSDAAAVETFEHVYRDGGWAAVAKTAVSEEIKLYLPKFEQKASGSLVDTLRSMGIVSAFDIDHASFAGIAEEIYIEQVFQNTVLKLDEAGTEAAAATVVVVAPTSAMPSPTQPRTVEFNRPFAFSVIDTASGAVLFTGEHNTAN